MGWISNLQAPNGIQLLIYMGHLFIPFLMSLPFGLSFALKRKFPTRSYYLFLPFFWMAYEYLEQFWELSFPLLNLGFGLSDFPFLIQYYEITGVRGGALLVLMCNIWIYLLISYWKTPRWKFLLLSGLSCGTLLLGFNYLLWNRAENIEVLSSKKIMVFQPNTNSYVEEEVSLPQSMSELDSLLDTMPHADILLTPEFYLKGSTPPACATISAVFRKSPAISALSTPTRQEACSAIRPAHSARISRKIGQLMLSWGAMLSRWVRIAVVPWA